MKLRLITLVLASLLFSMDLPSQKLPRPKGARVSIKGHVLASVSYATGYLRGGFGDRYQVFVFGIDSEPQSGSPPLVKVMYRFFAKTDSALPDSFFDLSKRYQLQVVRDPGCDETVQSLSYQKNEDEKGESLPPTNTLRPVDGVSADTFKLDLLLPCYILTPKKYKTLSDAE